MSAPAANPRDVRTDVGFARLKQHIIVATGLAYYADKEDELALHVARRLTALPLPSCEAYLALLREPLTGERELDLLCATLTIGETFFFRHRELFQALRETVFPALIAKNQAQRRLRIWSAGCAIGAECYSLAILLWREFGRQLEDWDVTILGTDINRDFLSHAQRGEFSEWAFRSAPDDLKLFCFNRAGQNWAIKEEFRRGVAFQYHNLVQHPFPSLVNNLSAFDLILCRNVMIYFQADVVARLVPQFHDCLVEDGWFVVGHAEPNIETFRDFRTVNAPGVVLYQRSSVANDTSAWPLLHDLPPANYPVWTLSPHAPREEIIARRVLPTANEIAPPNVALADVRKLLDQGRWAAAQALCQRLADAERLSSALHLYRALLAEQSGQHAAAEQSLRRAIYLDRNFVLAHYYLGLSLQRGRDYNAAQRCLRNVLALLAPRDEMEVLADADGLTVGELRRLSQMHVEVLQGS